MFLCLNKKGVANAGKILYYSNIPATKSGLQTVNYLVRSIWLPMEHAFKCIQNMAYPGRLIILGMSPSGETVALYAITGRSPSSQARRLEITADPKKVVVFPTDEATLRTGNPDLLVYPAIICGQGIAISNGTQTEAVFQHIASDAYPVDVLSRALRMWDYEPDEPNFTPRISGCITCGAALSIIKRSPQGSSVRYFFEVPLTRGAGKMIATYTGAQQQPLPSFSGEPLDVLLPWTTPHAAAQALYEALAPQPGNPDFRVATAAVFAGDSITIHVINRHS